MSLFIIRLLPFELSTFFSMTALQHAQNESGYSLVNLLDKVGIIHRAFLKLIVVVNFCLQIL